MVLQTHGLYAVHVWSRLVENEGYFTPDAEVIFRPYLPFLCSGTNETSNVELHTHGLNTVHVWLKSVRNEGYFTLRVETPFVPVSPLIGRG
jgi:hypothetical protein